AHSPLTSQGWRQEPFWLAWDLPSCLCDVNVPNRTSTLRWKSYKNACIRRFQSNFTKNAIILFNVSKTLLPHIHALCVPSRRKRPRFRNKPDSLQKVYTL